MQAALIETITLKRKLLEKLAERKPETVLIWLRVGQTADRIHQSLRGENAKKIRTVSPPNKLMTRFSSGWRSQMGGCHRSETEQTQFFCFGIFLISMVQFQETVREVSRAETSKTVLIWLRVGQTAYRIHQSLRGENAKKMRTVSPPNKSITRFSSGRHFSTGWVSPIRNEEHKFSVSGFFSFRCFSSSEFEICYQKFVEKDKWSGSRNGSHLAAGGDKLRIAFINLRGAKMKKMRTLSPPPNKLVTRFSSGRRFSTGWVSSIRNGERKFSVSNFSNGSMPHLIRNVNFEKHSFKPSQSFPRCASGAKRTITLKRKTAREVRGAETRNGSHLATGGTNSVRLSHLSISEWRKCEESENRFPFLTRW
ncbi:hypothetical protein CEXT_585241 [Caerostris extrusa]|uniref:Uncharacterized protein n=1 Tax=Caerostris extrusa TaxID=172846 RepID=A0AAV4QJX4_CAEEX|nr:hypothetical protein CEXT_585241 [Caerostris extrusa]